jgi:diguanylate cyclase (GGDEF)-like protein/PAS domain S-box-containing protein
MSVSDDLFERAFANAPSGLALVDMTGQMIHVNAMLCHITGYTPEELRERPFSALTDPGDADAEARQIADLIAGRIPAYHLERQCRHALGHRLPVMVSVSLVLDVERKPLHLVAQVQDISERKEREERLEYLVDHDALTGLFNARHFEQALMRGIRLSARYGGGGAVLLFDLDRFKSVNDQFGHKAGDDLLRAVSATLRGRIRETDVLARLGGDEFGILLPRATIQEAEASADGLVKALRHHTATLGDRQIPVTASVGVAMFDGLSEREIMVAADLAMYEAKEAGRDRFVVYRPRTDGPSHGSMRMAEAERVRRAVTHDQFELYGQPVLDLEANVVEQYELLLRLRTDDRQLLTPSAFLHLAERFGTTVSIDSWVVGRACILLADQTLLRPGVRISVNISAKSIGGPELITALDRALADSQIDPARLVFELTETAAIGNLDQARTFLTEVRARGCRIALDDFGAGFGSYHYLKRLPFDYFKINGDLVRGCATSTSDRLIIEAMVGVARGMGTKTIAKAVTDEETTDCLYRSGIDYAQGFYIGAPRPLADALAADRDAEGRELTGLMRRPRQRCAPSNRPPLHVGGMGSKQNLTR